MSLGDRRWRVRGLDRQAPPGSLRVNLLAGRGERFHVDVLDLYSARARQAFVTAAAAELGADAAVVKADLGRVLLACEEAAGRSAASEPEPAAMTSADRDAALALLRDPDLRGRIIADFAALGIAGEQASCLALYLAAVSRKLERPLAVVIQSSSAAGKSALLDAALALVPPEDLVSYSAMTGQSLFYMGETDLARKVLAIAEEEGAHRAAYPLKLLQSEGRLSIASTGKDPDTGMLVTRTYTVTGPAAILLTTTSVEVDEELVNRCMVLAVDEDQAQTEAIHAAQRRARTLHGLAARVRRDEVIAVHRNAQRLIEPVAVVNPFAEQLTFASGRTRARRDHGKYLALIDTVTLLHQHQRDRKSITIAGKDIAYIEVTPADIAVANGLAHEILGRSLDDLPPVTRRLLDAIAAWVMAQAEQQGTASDKVAFTRRQLREALGWSDTALKVHLARLADLELITARPAPSGWRYQLTWRGEGEDGTAFLPGLADPASLAGDGYDPSWSGRAEARSGQGEVRSASGQPPARGRSAPGQGGPDTASAQAGGIFPAPRAATAAERMDTGPGGEPGRNGTGGES